MSKAMCEDCGHMTEIGDEAEAAFAELWRLAGDLVAALPKCDECSAPATKAFARGQGRWCDDHARDCDLVLSSTVPDYPRAAPLRALLSFLARYPGGRVP